MHVLLFAHNAYTEMNSGAARSLSNIMAWLAESGITCTAIGSGRFDQSPIADITTLNNQAAAAAGTSLTRTTTPGPMPVARFTTGGVNVTSVETRGTALDESPEGVKQLAAIYTQALDRLRPDLVLSYGGHPVVQGAMKLARSRSIQTVFTLRAFGYDSRDYYAHADRVLLNSGAMVTHYRQSVGLQNAAYLPSPMDWNAVIGPCETRGFVTFINPVPNKGLAFFARLADMLGAMRPDIPILIVQSGASAEPLAALGLGRYPQILVSPPIADQRQLYALTRILLVPSVYAEPFGRVAAEALINGIPPIVSDRGGLPETVGDGGIVLPLPEWMTPQTTQIPQAAEVKPWFDAVVRLWDDAAEYERACVAAKQAAIRLYDEQTLKRRYVDYFTAKPPFPPHFPE